jgi:lipid II:glycine glycyltransferase (peptidoglycan interpeptide bridge formation enzyme)
MVDVFKDADKHYPRLHAAIGEGNGEILSLILSVQVAVFGELIGVLTSRSVIYGGVLYVDSVDGKDSLVPLIHAYNRSVQGRVLLTEIRNVCSSERLKKELEQCGYRYEGYLNYLIDLRRPPDKIFQSFSSSCRRNIRKSERNGLVVEEIVNRERLAICYEILRKTYSKAKVPLADLSLFTSAFEKLHSTGNVKFFLAKLGDQYIATRVVLLYKKRIFDWYAGADSDHLDSYPNETLVHHILGWGCRNGFDSFDFGGAGKPDEKYGVRDFKARFGGKLVNYGRYVQVDSPGSLEISKIAYEIYRRFL